MKIRDKQQSMGLWLNEVMILQPEKIEAAMRDLGAQGYGICRAILRNTNLSHRSPEVVQAIAVMVKAGHLAGIKCVLDCEPHADPVARDLGSLFPQAMVTRLVRAEVELVRGRFLLHIPSPAGAGKMTDFLGIEAAFLQDDGGIRRLEHLPFEVSYEGEIYDTGFATAEHYYVEGRPAVRRMHSHISGKVDGVQSGRLIVYARFYDGRQIDFWSEGCSRYYELLLECYRGIPLDGVGWDEPAFGGAWNNYLYGAAFAEAFARLNGYELRDRLYLLDEPEISAEAVRVRLDYYRTLNEGLFNAQRLLIHKAREIFGPDLLLGTHHTWRGEGGAQDYRAGAVDYFRLNDNMDAGYTDCCWWDPGSVAYAYTLGSSLGRLTPSGEAEVNTWHWKPTNSLVEYNARLMSLMDITWFNICYGERADTCRYPDHYTWPTTVRETRMHRERQQVIGRARPVVDLAIWHGWEGVTAINRADLASAHKAFCLNTARLLLDRSIPFDWVDSRLLAEGRAEEGRFGCDLGYYSILILPYANVLPRAAWRKCVEFARGGGRLIFVGPPPAFDETGQSLQKEFAELLDMPDLPLDEYLAGLDAQCTLPEDRAERLDVAFPLSGETDRLLVSQEGDPHGICSPGKNVVYLSALDPREHLVGVFEPWLRPSVVCYSETMLWRLYRDGKRELLVVAARKDRVLRGLVRFAGHVVEFTDGTVAIIESRPGSFRVHGKGTWQITQDEPADESAHAELPPVLDVR